MGSDEQYLQTYIQSQLTTLLVLLPRYNHSFTGPTKIKRYTDLVKGLRKRVQLCFIQMSQNPHQKWFLTLPATPI